MKVRRVIRHLEHRGDLVMNVQYISLLGDTDRVLRSDIPPAAHLLDGGIDDDIVQGLVPGLRTAGSGQSPLGSGRQENIEQGTVRTVRAVGVLAILPTQRL